MPSKKKQTTEAAVRKLRRCHEALGAKGVSSPVPRASVGIAGHE